MTSGAASIGASRFRPRSIKARVTLFTLASFLIGTLALALYSRDIVRQTAQLLLGQQQQATATFIAAGVDHELDERRAAIAAVAAGLTLSDDEPALSKHLAQRQDWPRLFNDGAFIVRADGVATASTERAGIGVEHWDFVGRALNDGQTSVGQPPSDSPTGAQIGFAQPLVDAHGKLIGALVGLATLDRATVLQRFAQGSDGQSVGYLVVAAKRRQVLAGSDQSGIAQMLASGAKSPLLDGLLDGDEGSAMVVNSRGDDVLVSAKAIPATDWRVLITLPGNGHFAPMRGARTPLALATIVVALLASAAVWLILRQQLTPMLTTIKTLATMSAPPPQPLAVPSQGEIADLIGAFNRLLTTLGQREDALRVAEAELRIAATAFESREGQVVTDANGVILRVNQAFTESTGYCVDEAVGQTPSLLKSGRHDDDFYRAMWATIDRTGSWQGEIWDRRKNGEIFPKWLTISAVKDRHGMVTHYVGAHFDITERKQQENQIHQLAFYDPLTALPNRRLFSDRLGQALAAGKRNACHGALMFIDLDNFKSLNDTHGHIAGDLLLVEAANRLRHCVREVDTVARFGGDEFVVLLSNLHAEQHESASLTRSVAEKIRSALGQPYCLTVCCEDGQQTNFEHRCSASIGVVLLTNDGTAADDLLKLADAAMYRAKAAGRNMIRFHDEN